MCVSGVRAFFGAIVAARHMGLKSFYTLLLPSSSFVDAFSMGFKDVV